MMIDPPSLNLRIVSCGIAVDGLGPGSCGYLGSARQCLRVDILPDLRHLAISNGDGEDPVVLKRPIRGFDFSRRDADDQNPVSLRHEFGGRWVFRFHLVARLLKHSRQFRVPAVRACQRPALARNDPLNIFGNQRQQIVLIVAAYWRKKILHNLDILLCAHRNLSISLTSDRVRSFLFQTDFKLLSLLERSSRKSIFLLRSMFSATSLTPPLFFSISLTT